MSSAATALRMRTLSVAPQHRRQAVLSERTTTARSSQAHRRGCCYGRRMHATIAAGAACIDESIADLAKGARGEHLPCCRRASSDHGCALAPEGTGGGGEAVSPLSEAARIQPLHSRAFPGNALHKKRKGRSSWSQRQRWGPKVPQKFGKSH